MIVSSYPVSPSVQSVYITSPVQILLSWVEDVRAATEFGIAFGLSGHPLSNKNTFITRFMHSCCWSTHWLQMRHSCKPHWTTLNASRVENNTITCANWPWVSYDSDGSTGWNKAELRPTPLLPWPLAQSDRQTCQTWPKCLYGVVTTGLSLLSTCLTTTASTWCSSQTLAQCSVNPLVHYKVPVTSDFAVADTFSRHIGPGNGSLRATNVVLVVVVVVVLLLLSDFLSLLSRS